MRTCALETMVGLAIAQVPGEPDTLFWHDLRHHGATETLENLIEQTCFGH
jgi:hypothetical protein